jgi:hypothetical protein
LALGLEADLTCGAGAFVAAWSSADLLDAYTLFGTIGVVFTGFVTDALAAFTGGTLGAIDAEAGMFNTAVYIAEATALTSIRSTGIEQALTIAADLALIALNIGA